MLQSIIVYSLLFVVMFIFAKVAAKNGSYLRTAKGKVKERSFWLFETIVPLLIFAIIFGMRFDVGTDHLSYLSGYYWKDNVSKGEVLFNGLTHLFQSLDIHYTVYFGVFAFIQVFFFFYAFKKERFLFPFLVFFIFMNGEFLSWMNIIRQSIAICIWLYAIKYIEERKIWKYLFWCVLAMGFHLSAIALIVFYPILRIEKNYFKNAKIQLIILGFVFIIQFLFASLMSRLEPLLQFYQSTIGDGSYAYTMDSLNDKLGQTQGSGLGYLFKILLNVIIIVYSGKLKKFYNTKRFTIIYFFFFIGLVTLYIFPIGSIILTRPFRYFYIFQSIMYAYFAYYLLKSNSELNKAVCIAVIIAFIGIFYLNQITSSANAHLWYQFYFQQYKFD